MHQCTRQCQFLFHTARESARLAIVKAFYLRIDGPNAIITLIYRRAKECSKEFQIFLHGQVLIEREPTRHISHTPTNIPHLANGVKAIYRCRSLIWQQQRAKDTEHRGLSCTIRSYQPKHFALVYGERNIV